MVEEIRPHQKIDGYCSIDQEEWPCSAVPPTAYTSSTVEYGKAQREGREWPEEMPRGLVAWGSA